MSIHAFHDHPAGQELKPTPQIITSNTSVASRVTLCYRNSMLPCVIQPNAVAAQAQKNTTFSAFMESP